MITGILLGLAAALWPVLIPVSLELVAKGLNRGRI